MKPKIFQTKTRTELEKMLQPGQCAIGKEDVREVVKWAISQEVKERSLPLDIAASLVGNCVYSELERERNESHEAIEEIEKEASEEADQMRLDHEKEIREYRERFKVISGRIMKGRDIRIASLESQIRENQQWMNEAVKRLETLRNLIRVGDELAKELI